MNAKSERASLPDRVEAAAPKRISTGQCYNCGWTRAAMLYDDRIVFSAWHLGLAGVSEPNKCYECRTWSSMRALAAADACEAERNPNPTDEQVGWYGFESGEALLMDHPNLSGPYALDEHALRKAGFVPLMARRRPVSSEDVHREAAE